MGSDQNCISGSDKVLLSGIFKCGRICGWACKDAVTTCKDVNMEPPKFISWNPGPVLGTS